MRTIASHIRKEYEDKKIVFVDIYEKEFDERYFTVHQFTGHASPYGNRVIAQAIYEAIKKPVIELQRGKDKSVDY